MQFKTCPGAWRYAASGATAGADCWLGCLAQLAARCRRRVKAHQFAAAGVPGSTESNMKRTRPTWEIQGRARESELEGGTDGEISGLVHTVQVLQGVPLQGWPQSYPRSIGTTMWCSH
ncbi:hypothetical protein PspLS_03571 [Pyricularia sp. CBS 133598]|nr:hypothetical protein PspLS_03571 [Pyricularia sp. CBS 133598]